MLYKANQAAELPTEESIETNFKETEEDEV